MIQLRRQIARTVFGLGLIGRIFAGSFPEIYNTEKAPGGPLPAVEAAASFKLPAGFHASVFAAEPDVQQPIAMTFDARGRLWVA